MKNARKVVSIQVVPFIAVGDLLTIQFGGADENTTGYGVYKRMNDDCASWHEDHLDFGSAMTQGIKLCTAYNVPLEGIDIPKTWTGNVASKDTYGHPGILKVPGRVFGQEQPATQAYTNRIRPIATSAVIDATLAAVQSMIDKLDWEKYNGNLGHFVTDMRAALTQYSIEQKGAPDPVGSFRDTFDTPRELYNTTDLNAFNPPTGSRKQMFKSNISDVFSRLANAVLMPLPTYADIDVLKEMLKSVSNADLVHISNITSVVMTFLTNHQEQYQRKLEAVRNGSPFVAADGTITSVSEGHMGKSMAAHLAARQLPKTLNQAQLDELGNLLETASYWAHEERVIAAASVLGIVQQWLGEWMATQEEVARQQDEMRKLAIGEPNDVDTSKMTSDEVDVIDPLTPPVSVAASIGDGPSPGVEPE